MQVPSISPKSQVAKELQQAVAFLSKTRTTHGDSLDDTPRHCVLASKDV